MFALIILLARTKYTIIWKYVRCCPDPSSFSFPCSSSSSSSYLCSSALAGIICLQGEKLHRFLFLPGWSFNEVMVMLLSWSCDCSYAYSPSLYIVPTSGTRESRSGHQMLRWGNERAPLSFATASPANEAIQSRRLFFFLQNETSPVAKRRPATAITAELHSRVRRTAECDIWNLNITGAAGQIIKPR